eukprot:gnl/TRDRNA2_/TRDRNA2_159038_c0_seq3.p1 gnl/TRDRNA2_/TRDRNA2_159038_c0~~gnl/TRDRNA2_/TRDRNA2_159038_c0_seq3.p1  ORF type:complete len:226 (+),score=35.90 gnl/TRDRNA2_/TRDRNA2_159038_c0_seq3:41-718(+)
MVGRYYESVENDTDFSVEVWWQQATGEPPDDGADGGYMKQVLKPSKQTGPRAFPMYSEKMGNFRIKHQVCVQVVGETWDPPRVCKDTRKPREKNTRVKYRASDFVGVFTMMKDQRGPGMDSEVQFPPLGAEPDYKKYDSEYDDPRFPRVQSPPKRAFPAVTKPKDKWSDDLEKHEMPDRDLYADNRIEYLIPGVVLASFVCVLIGIKRLQRSSHALRRFSACGFT